MDISCDPPRLGKKLWVYTLARGLVFGANYIKRWNPHRGVGADAAREEPISTKMLARIANAFVPYQPINFDRILGASYNTRSVLEALLAHTPQFYVCRPGRIDSYTGKITTGHKHLMWCPNEPHTPNQITLKDTEIVISEVTVPDANYDALDVPEDVLRGEIDIDIKRRHTQIQVALVMIGKQLNFRTWVAREDRGIIYNNQRIGELDGVVETLGNEPLIAPFEGAILAAQSIDCIWFRNNRHMPAIMEIEHSTKVTSGLTRMKELESKIPAINTRYVIVADDLDRREVVEKSNREQFRSLNVRFFPYSAVEELYVLCQRRKIRGVQQEFLDSYMEPILTN